MSRKRQGGLSNHFAFSRSFLKRSVALGLCLCLVIPEGLASVPLSSQHGLKQKFVVPQAFGTLDESHQGASSKTLIYIQDAHDSLEVQENISHLIHHFVQHHHVETVFTEGYEGHVPTDEYFEFIPEQRICEKLAYFLMDKLRLGGAEYAHITRKKEFQLLGADSHSLHLENIRVYRESAKLKKGIAKDLKEMTLEIRRLANRYFPAEFKSWLKMKSLFELQQLGVVEYLDRC